MTEEIDKGINWDGHLDFEVLESINKDIKEVGDKVKVTFLSEEKLVAADKIMAARKKKGIVSRIKPVDSFVFKVQEIGSDKAKSLWLKTTQHTNIRELAELRRENKNSLIGVKAVIEKLQSGDMTRPSIAIRKL